MSPRSADPNVRMMLVEAAARVLAEEGPAALTSRRLATEIGTSTMAVFSRFRTMAEVRLAIREEGFARLSARLDALPSTDDPVADLVASGEVYFAAGLANPHLYRAMFIDPPPADDNLGAGAYQRLESLIGKCVAAGRFPAAEAFSAPVWAAQMWSMRHGMVIMSVAGLLPDEQARFVLSDMTFRLLIGYGDEPERARRSIDAAGLVASGTEGER